MYVIDMTWRNKDQVVFCPEDSSTIRNTNGLAMDKCKHGVYVFVDRCKHGCLFIVESLGPQYYSKRGESR